MIDSIINCKNIEKADCVLLTAGYDRTVSGGKGAKDGGIQIIKCLHEDVEFFDRYNLIETGYTYKIAHKESGISNDLLPEQMVENLNTVYGELLDKNRFVVLLGGEHSVSNGAFQAISKKYNPQEITIFQIDAHCDLRNDDGNANPDQSHVSKYAHSCVMRRAHELGFNIVQVGIRSYAKEEYDFFKQNDRIKVFEWGKPKIPSIDELINNIPTEKIYITVDVDGIDPAHMPATGTPVPGGLDWYYATDLLLDLIRTKEIVGFDIVEVAPRENETLTQYSAAQLCYNMIGTNLIKNKTL